MRRILIIAVLIGLLAAAAGLAAAETCGDYEYAVQEDGSATIVRYTGNAAELVVPAELDGHPVTGIAEWAFMPRTDDRDPAVIYGEGFLSPGTYFSIYDANIAAYNTATVHRITQPDAEQTRADSFLSESQLQAMVRYFARRWAWEQGWKAIDDAMRDPDHPSDQIPSDPDLIKNRRIQNLQAQIDMLTASIVELRARMEGVSEHARTNMQRRIDALTAEIEDMKAEIAAIGSARFCTDAEAIRLWSEETGLSADNAHRAELLELWDSEYRPVVATASPEDLAALGIEGFHNGTDFITNPDGLGFLQAYARDLYRIEQTLAVYPSGTMTYTVRGSDGGGIEQHISLTDYVSVEDVANHITFPMGTDQFGHDLSIAGESNLTSVVIPEGVTRIGSYAFLDCRNLTDVTLPASLESWGIYAFSVRVAKPELGTGEIRDWYEINSGITFTVAPGSAAEETCVLYEYPYVTAE